MSHGRCNLATGLCWSDSSQPTACRNNGDTMAHRLGPFIEYDKIGYQEEREADGVWSATAITCYESRPKGVVVSRPHRRETHRLTGMARWLLG